MKSFAKFVLVILGIALLFSIFSHLNPSKDLSDELKVANIGVIEIEGVISESLPILDQINQVRENSQLKALVVRINSPGGAVGASQEIYLELKKLREKLPIVISMGDLAASGGLYVAIAGQTLVALPGTLTGSMGVLFQLTNFSRLVDKALIDPTTIRSGDLKDAGNPLKPMDPRAKKLFEELVKQTFDGFRKSVVEERKLKPEAVDLLSDGRVVNGEQALKLGLIDKLGTFQDAIDIAKEKSKLSDKPRLVYLSREPKSWVEKVLNSQIQSLRQEFVRALQSSATLQYIWKP